MAQLIRGLGLAGAVSINIANIIGTGVFLKARVMTCNVESAPVVIAVWIGAALLVLAGALCYSELTAMMPEAGGEYVFLRTAYGERMGFLYGWTYILISRAGSLAAQSVSTAIFFNIATGGMLEGRLALGSVVALWISMLVNAAPVKTTGAIAATFTVVKVLFVAGLAAVIVLWGRGDWANYALSGAGGACASVPEAARGGMAGVAAAMLGALWGYQGWANLTPVAGEVRNPERNISRGFLIALGVVATVYVSANIAYYYVLTPREVASVSLSSSVATEALTRIFGAGVAGLMAIGMLVSSAGALHSGLTATMRVPYAMARDGLYFQVLGKLSANGVPVRSAVYITALSSLLALSGSYDKLTDWAIFALWLFYGLTTAAVIVLRRKMPDAPRPFRVPGYPVVPVVFLLVTAWLLVNTAVTTPVSALIGVGLMLAGIPYYWWLKR
ncbi:MAG: amino acid permease [Bryobacteraceae bacterium]